MGLFTFVKTLFDLSKQQKRKPHKKKVQSKAQTRKKKRRIKSTKKKRASRSAKISREKGATRSLKGPPKKRGKRKTSPAVKKSKGTIKEKEIGVITHYFRKISVGIIKLTKGNLSVGDAIHIKGAHNDFRQSIFSMQLNHKDITRAPKGKEIGIKVPRKVHVHDKVYLITK